MHVNEEEVSESRKLSNRSLAGAGRGERRRLAMSRQQNAADNVHLVVNVCVHIRVVAVAVLVVVVVVLAHVVHTPRCQASA